MLDQFPEPPNRADSDSRSTNYAFTGQPAHPSGPQSAEWGKHGGFIPSCLRNRTHRVVSSKSHVILNRIRHPLPARLVLVIYRIFGVLRGAGVPTTADIGLGRYGAFYICRDKQGQDSAISEPVSTKGEKGENYKNCPRFPRPPPKNGFRPAGTRFILRRLRVLSGSPQNEDREEINTPIRIDCSRASP